MAPAFLQTPPSKPAPGPQSPKSDHPNHVTLRPRYIPSVARPDQADASAQQGQGAPGLATAADNATDIPRGPADRSTTGEIITGTGDQLNSSTETKRLHEGANNPLAKGHDRYDKHARGDSEFVTGAEEGMPGVAPDVSQGEDVLNTSRDVKDA